MVVHPLDHGLKEEARSSNINKSGSSNYKIRIKVKMSKRQLKEFMSQVDLSEGSSELGRMVLQECLDGRLTARVVGGQGLALATENANSLATIKEE